MSNNQPEQHLSDLLAPQKRLALILVVCLAGSLGPGKAATPEPSRRLILIKVDGLAADQLAAAAVSENPEFMRRLPYGRDFKEAIREYLDQSGRQILLPNIRQFFFEDGVVFDNMYSHTLTLSAAAWGVIDTGQPSIVKGHATFSRDTCYLRSHLDGFRDFVDFLKRQPGYGEGKTGSTWVLDQIGDSLMLDAYDPIRAWSGPQIFRRIANRTHLLEMGKQWLRADGTGFGGILRGHLSRLVTGMDYTEFNQQMSSFATAHNALEKDLTGRERFDYLSPLFTLMDHQQHVDPHPVNLVHWLVKLDEAVGQIFWAVAQSDRRDETIVALASDHGSEIKPGKVGFSFPLSKHFREPLLGGHNVKTLLVESAWSAVSTPVPGIDWPRLYESDYSPYNKKGDPKNGEKGFATSFIDPFGNGRASIHLRNDDLNRLHLILLALKRAPDPARFQRLKQLFEKTLLETRRWLEPDLELWRDYQAGAEDYAQNLNLRADGFSQDTALRLRKELKRNAPQIEVLERLLSVHFEPQPGQENFDQVFSKPFRVSDYIPKQYLGLANNVYQLTHYTLGLDNDLKWIQTTVDHQGNPRDMDYFEILSNYRAANAPVNGLANPFDLIVTRIDVPEGSRTLQAKGLIQSSDRLRELVFVKSSHQSNPDKGGEALIVSRLDGSLSYLPIRNLNQRQDGTIDFETANDVDPLALLADGGFSPAGSKESRLNWMRQFRPWREWAQATHRTEYSIAVTIILDLLQDAAPQFVENAEFQKYLIHFSSNELKQRYLRGLKRKYQSRAPDLTVWADELWNFNAKARTSGGNHSGLRPIVSKTTFLVWGGSKTGVAKSKIVEEVSTTLDIAPTLFRAVGMLDDENHVVRAPGANPERPFLPFPGQVADIFSTGKDLVQEEHPPTELKLESETGW